MPTNIAGTVVNDEEYIQNAELQATLAAVSHGIVQRVTAALSPVAVAANTTAEQSLLVNTPAGATDVVSVTKPTAQAGLGIVGVRRIDATHIGVTFCNDTAAPITPTPAETYAFFFFGFAA